MAIPGEAFERILAALNEAVFERGGWRKASAVIDEACGMHGSMLIHGTGNSLNELRVHFAMLNARGERREDFERLYCDHYIHVDERLPRMMYLPEGRVAHVTDMLTKAELERSAVYNEYFLRVRKQDGIDLRLDGPDGSHIFWSILDSIHSDGWSSDQLRLIDAVSPHIRQYVRMQEVLAEAGGQNVPLANMLDLSGIGVIQIDMRGRILMVNDRAGAVLQHRDGLADRGGVLCAVAPKDDDRLQRLLARALPRLGGPAVNGSMTVLRPLQRPGLTVHVHPVVNREAGYVGRRVAAFVLIVDPLGQGNIAPDLVASALDLTSTEAEIAMLLAEGWTARQIAAKTGRAYGTVRTHLKHIFSKLGVSRQYEVARQVLALSSLPPPRD